MHNNTLTFTKGHSHRQYLHVGIRPRECALSPIAAIFVILRFHCECVIFGSTPRSYDVQLDSLGVRLLRLVDLVRSEYIQF